MKQSTLSRIKDIPDIRRQVIAHADLIVSLDEDRPSALTPEQVKLVVNDLGTFQSLLSHHFGETWGADIAILDAEANELQRLLYAGATTLIDEGD